MKIVFDDSGRMQLSSKDPVANEILTNYFDTPEPKLGRVEGPKLELNKLRTIPHRRSFNLKDSTEHVRTSIEDNVFSIAYWLGIGRTGNQERAKLRKRLLSFLVVIVVVPFLFLIVWTSNAKVSTVQTAPTSEQTTQATAASPDQENGTDVATAETQRAMADKSADSVPVESPSEAPEPASAVEYTDDEPDTSASSEY